jgi:hypothetical protein
VAGKKRREATQLSQELLDSGSKLYLVGDDGKPSNDFVVVLSKWNDAVRFELDDTEREGLQLLAKEGVMPHQVRGDLIRRVHCQMVASWGGTTTSWEALGGKTFDQAEFNQENVKTWIRANPQHAEAIDDRSATDRFFTKASTSSSSGSGTSDD